MSQIIPEQSMCYRAKEALTDPDDDGEHYMEFEINPTTTQRLAWPESRK